MIFKLDWEKTDTQITVSRNDTVEMVNLGLPSSEISSCELISGGCANLNIKINLKDNSRPKLLRVYVRDKDAAYREKNIAQLLSKSLPIPNTDYIGNINQYRFAIVEFMDGITLRELLTSNEQIDLYKIMYEVGVILSQISKYKFNQPGFFDIELNIEKQINQNGIVSHGLDCLISNPVLDTLSSKEISNIKYYLNKYIGLLFNENSTNLVHGDFDPANILVVKIDNKWSISAILDWEFSFAGSLLSDVANMLRYKHLMSGEFENGFLDGIRSQNVELPIGWEISVHMLNLVALLDCLKRSNQNTMPNRCKDIHILIKYILEKLDAESK